MLRFATVSTLVVVGAAPLAAQSDAEVAPATASIAADDGAIPIGMRECRPWSWTDWGRRRDSH